MASNAAARSDVSAGEIVASVDGSATHPAFIIADITRDDAWMAMPHDAAPRLTDWA
ncbi:MAG: hypothetical protein RI531_08775 [Haloferacaceae archaeon]|nr:hypothetical protein [Haloferacaceae archaeon]